MGPPTSQAITTHPDVLALIDEDRARSTRRTELARPANATRGGAGEQKRRLKPLTVPERLRDRVSKLRLEAQRTLRVQDADNHEAGRRALLRVAAVSPTAGCHCLCPVTVLAPMLHGSERFRASDNPAWDPRALGFPRRVSGVPRDA